MDPSSKQFEEDLRIVLADQNERRKLKWLIFMHRINEALPEIGPITGIITVGEMILWMVMPPELQSSWSMFLSIWAAALLICIGLISVPKRYAYNAHWLSGD